MTLAALGRVVSNLFATATAWKGVLSNKGKVRDKLYMQYLTAVILRIIAHFWPKLPRGRVMPQRRDSAHLNMNFRLDLNLVTKQR